MLIDQIKEDFKKSLREKEAVKTSVLRLLMSAWQTEEIKNKRKELTDEQGLKIVRSEIKKRKEAAELYEQGGRSELAEKEREEMEILKKYLPPQLSEEELRDLVVRLKEEAGAESQKGFGKLMGRVMKETGGKADSSLVKKVVEEALAAGD